MRAGFGRAVWVAMGAVALGGCGKGDGGAPPGGDSRVPGAPGPAGSGAMVALELELPKAQFIGTPPPINLPNLDRTPGEKRASFRVPVGLTKLARGKTVSASDAFPMLGDLARVTDGDKAGQDGSYVELGPNKQWVQVDLGEPSELFAVVLWLRHDQPRAYQDVVVQVSDDPDFAREVQTIFNSDQDNSSGFGAGRDMAYIESNYGKIIDAKGARCRYVRANTNGSTADEMNHFTEVEVYGRAVK